MKKLRSLMVVFLLAGAGHGLRAEAGAKPAEKSPGDIAAAEFSKLRDDKVAKPDAARFQAVIASGISFLTQYPTHSKAASVINALATFGTTMKDKSQASLRAAWLARLKYEVLSERQKPDLTDEVRTAITALEAAVAGEEARVSFSRDSLSAFRENIDTLAALPGSERFLSAQELNYVELLKNTRLSAAEAHLAKLREHSDKKVVQMANDQLNLIEVNKQPYELKFTALDGRQVDFAQLRGKVVLLCFWSTTNDRSVQEQAQLPTFYDTYRKRGFEIVGVACDKEEDREKLTKFVKKNNLSWPQYFDGRELKNDFGPKLNVRSLPVSFLFDQKGMLVGGKPLAVDQLNTHVKRLLDIK